MVSGFTCFTANETCVTLSFALRADEGKPCIPAQMQSESSKYQSAFDSNWSSTTRLT